MDHLASRLRRRARRLAFEPIDRWRVGDVPFCIISDDCWGAEVYRHLNRAYNTPFVGLMVGPDDYLRLLADLERYLAQPMTFRDEWGHFAGRRYPVGLLDDVELHLLHYGSTEEAAEKWKRRVARIDHTHLAVKFDASKAGVRPRHVEMFHALPFPRKLVYARPGVRGTVTVSDWTLDGAAMFARTQRTFDVVTWLRSGGVAPSAAAARLAYG
jgi:uncharacterized protein (DUF1919 family)